MNPYLRADTLLLNMISIENEKHLIPENYLMFTPIA